VGVMGGGQKLYTLVEARVEGCWGESVAAGRLGGQNG